MKYAIRTLLKNPRFSLVAVAAMALGVGVNAAIFSVVNVVLLQPLPYPDATRLVRICREFPAGVACAESIPKYLSAAKAQSLDAIAAYDFAGPGLNLSGGGLPQQVKGIHVSAVIFPRVRGVAGGWTDVQRPGRSRRRPARRGAVERPVAVARFGGDPAIAGRTISLNGDPYVVVGVLGARFRSEPPADVYIPLQADPNSTNHGHYLSVAGHLKPGVSVSAARAEMTLLGDQFRRANPKWMDERRARGRLRYAGHRGAATCGRRCWCCSVRSGSSCSSPAPTSPTCSWRAPPGASARSPSARPSARAARGSSGSSSSRACCCRSLGAVAGCDRGGVGGAGSAVR